MISLRFQFLVRPRTARSAYETGNHRTEITDNLKESLLGCRCSRAEATEGEGLAQPRVIWLGELPVLVDSFTVNMALADELPITSPDRGIPLMFEAERTIAVIVR